MKKVLLVLFLFIISIPGLYADEYVISKVQCLMENFGRINTEEISFKYDDENDLYYLQRSTYTQIYVYIFKPSDLEQLRSNFLKANNWIKIAKDNKVSVSPKEMPNSAIPVKGAMKSGSNWYTTRLNIPLKFFFACDVNESFYTLTIKGGSEKSSQNEFIDIEFDLLVFFNEQIDAFIDAISPENIERAKAKHQQEKKASELFQ